MLEKIFYDIDEFCKSFIASWQQSQIADENRKCLKPCSLCLSEIMTIIVFFHISGYRTFKHYYIKHVCKNMKNDFSGLVSYNRFVELMQGALVPLLAYMKQCRGGKATGISFIDSTPLTVCHNRRIHCHKTFDGLAQRGKTSMGWFYGFKLHVIVNDRGDLLSVMLTPGNVADGNITVITKMARDLFGKLFGDRGYISKKLRESLRE